MSIAPRRTGVRMPLAATGNHRTSASAGTGTEGPAISGNETRRKTPRPSSDARPRSAISAELRATNRAFNRFLNIGRGDRALLGRYRAVLGANAADFARVFYDYLLEHPATADVLKEYQRAGGSIDTLVRLQTRHLHELLDARTDPAAASKMARIGEIHHRHAIAPVWIMGAYRRYLDHLLAIVHRDPRIRDADRRRLEGAVTKLLFRDMGLMLEGYWVASNTALACERDKLTRLQQRVTDLLANIPQLLWSVDVVSKRPLYVSPAARAICDRDIAMPIPCLSWTVPEQRPLVAAAWERALRGESSEVETQVRPPGGTPRWFRRVFHPYRDADGRVRRVDGVMEDVTETRAMTARLEVMATTDSLTGLPNRTLFLDRLTRAIASAARGTGRHVAVLLMDLDHFKDINDTLGHPAGDRVLVEIARRLARELRDEDTVTRLGGDEFAVLLPAIRLPLVTAGKIAAKLLGVFAAPVHHDGHELHLGASLGISVYPVHGTDAATLLARADVAMYAAKAQGLHQLYYDPALDPGVGERLQLSNELRHAVERREFYLEFQPQIDLARRRVLGAEALLRWRRRGRGVGPAEFIPLAERTGQIQALTDWVFAEALARCGDWRASGHDLHVAVNVSGRLLQNPRFADRVLAAIARAGVPARCLEIEITENVLMSDIEHTGLLLRELYAHGARISIDDFGTGYSSLAYLKRLPLNALKIDQSFIRDMATDAGDAAIVRSIIDLGHNLGREVVAEGVEDARALALLREYGCDSAQGYYFGRPMPDREFRAWLAANPA